VVGDENGEYAVFFDEPVTTDALGVGELVWKVE